MDITCFYEPIIVNDKLTDFSEDSQELIKLWEKSWSDNGWNPIVLSLNDAKRHPRYYEIDLKNYSSNLYKYSSNPLDYLELCYSRWFAYGLYDGMWSDYDVMNYGFKPEDVKYFSQYEPVFFDIIGSCGFATKEGHNKIIEGFINAYKYDTIINNVISAQAEHKEFNDTHINRRPGSPISISATPLCKSDFSNDEWKSSKLVHYHNGLWFCFKNHEYRKRSEFIKKERPV